MNAALGLRKQCAQPRACRAPAVVADLLRPDGNVSGAPPPWLQGVSWRLLAALGPWRPIGMQQQARLFCGVSLPLACSAPTSTAKRFPDSVALPSWLALLLGRRMKRLAGAPPGGFCSRAAFAGPVSGWGLVAQFSPNGEPWAGWSRGWPVLEDWGLVVNVRLIPAGVGANMANDQQRRGGSGGPAQPAWPVVRGGGGQPGLLGAAPCPSRQAGCWGLFRCHLLCSGAPGAGLRRGSYGPMVTTGLASEPGGASKRLRAFAVGEPLPAVAKGEPWQGSAWRKAPCWWPNLTVWRPTLLGPPTRFCLLWRGLCDPWKDVGEAP